MTNAPPARLPTTTIARIAGSGEPEPPWADGPATDRSMTAAVVVVVRPDADAVVVVSSRVELGATVEPVGGVVAGDGGTLAGTVAAETGGAAVIAVTGVEEGGALVGGAVARVVGGVGIAADGRMPGCARFPNAKASMLPGAGR